MVDCALNGYSVGKYISTGLVEEVVIQQSQSLALLKFFYYYLCQKDDVIHSHLSINWIIEWIYFYMGCIAFEGNLDQFAVSGSKVPLLVEVYAFQIPGCIINTSADASTV